MLGVAEDASQKEITKAYRKLARQNHPDANPGDAIGRGALQGDLRGLRRRGRRGQAQGVRRGPQAGPDGAAVRRRRPGRARSRLVHLRRRRRLGDLLGNLFGRGRRRRRRPAGASGRGGATTSRPTLRLAFTDAVHGVTTALQLTSDAACSHVPRHGRQARARRRTCARPVAGAASSTTTRACSRSPRPAPRATARASSSTTRARPAAGPGVERRPREVKVRIPAGVSDGQRIRLKGRGAPGRNGGPPGDLFVECSVEPHPLFGRDGDDLTAARPHHLSPRPCWAPTSRCPLLDGGKVTHPAEAGHAARLEVPGEGPRHRHQASTRVT